MPRNSYPCPKAYKFGKQSKNTIDSNVPLEDYLLNKKSNCLTFCQNSKLKWTNIYKKNLRIWCSFYLYNPKYLDFTVLLLFFHDLFTLFLIFYVYQRSVFLFIFSDLVKISKIEIRSEACFFSNYIKLKILCFSYRISLAAILMQFSELLLLSAHNKIHMCSNGGYL